MKKLTALLAIVFTLLLGFVAWFFLGGTLRGEAYIRTARAADYPEAFESVRGQIISGSAIQVLGGEAPTDDPSGYTLVDITITLANRGLFPAEWLDVRVEPAPGDIAVYTLTGEGIDIPARDRGQVNLKLVTTARPDAERAIVIQYYVYGMPREITVR